jgi:hypothetical protein
MRNDPLDCRRRLKIGALWQLRLRHTRLPRISKPPRAGTAHFFSDGIDVRNVLEDGALDGADTQIIDV